MMSLSALNLTLPVSSEKPIIYLMFFLYFLDVVVVVVVVVVGVVVGISSSGSSSRTYSWVHFQQNTGLRLFVHTWIVHGIDDCYQLTRTFAGLSAQCLSKLFLKEFTVLLLTTSLGRAFQVVVILIS